MNPKLLEDLSIATDQAMRKFPYSVGLPRLDDFDLAVLPPWSGHDEDEVLRVEITSAAVVCVSGERVLMVHMVNENDRWDLPAGGRDERDISPLDTARREFFEETGLVLETALVEPFGYAYRDKGNGKKTGGIQYLALQEIPIPKDAQADGMGRVYIPPFEGAISSEVDRLVLEPLEVFMSGMSLLNSPNSWAYRRAFGSLRSRLASIYLDFS